MRFHKPLKINKGLNPYAIEVQGKANEGICVAMLLDRAWSSMDLQQEASLEDIYDRLENNAPRVAVIMGSPDQPAHVMDHEVLLKAVAAIWKNGGVPFAFGIPVMCDGAAQSTSGMCYSLESRNAVSAMVVNQMEGQHYHGAFVIQGCDKTPFALVNALSSLDVTRQERGDAPVFATFAPAHVLRGGTVPDELRHELLMLAAKSDQEGSEDIGDDIRHTMKHILQCSTNQAFQGVLKRAVQKGFILHEKHKELEKQISVNTCDRKGGICAFNGTGNSSRHLVAGLGLVHPVVEFLTEPATFEQVDESICAMLSVCNDPDYSVSNIVVQNIENAIRVHSTMGGSTNLIMHLVSSMIYSGYKFTVHDYERIRMSCPIPSLTDFSLTDGRDIFALAQQCCEGLVGGIETVVYELKRNGVPINEDAPTVTGMRWGTRLKKGKRLSADNVAENPILLSKPKRPESGIDVLSGNWLETAVVKISGMPLEQLNEFDERVAVVTYFENEEEATATLLNVDLLEQVQKESWFKRETLLQLYRINTGKESSELESITDIKELFQRILDEDGFRLAAIIACQGPKAFGMPEMFTPMHHINHNKVLRRVATIISDGRYSGVSYGAAIGHVTPEAYDGGGILYLETGDLIHLRLRKRCLDLLDSKAFANGNVELFNGDLKIERADLGKKRMKMMQKRRRMIDPSNLMDNTTDASQGVVPMALWDRAEKMYTPMSECLETEVS